MISISICAPGTYDDIKNDSHINLNCVFSVYSARKVKTSMRKATIYLQYWLDRCTNPFFTVHAESQWSCSQCKWEWNQHLFSGASLCWYFQDKSARYKYKCVEICWNGSPVVRKWIQLTWDMSDLLSLILTLLIKKERQKERKAITWTTQTLIHDINN